jgi:hypothetical protein
MASPGSKPISAAIESGNTLVILAGRIEVLLIRKCVSNTPKI